MVTIRAHSSDSTGRARRRLSQVASLGLGLAMFGTVGLSGTLAQDDNAMAGGDTGSIVNSIIEQVFAQIFGGGVVTDDATGSGAGNLDMGGSSGSTVTMGGGGGNVNMSGGGGVMMGDDSGG